MISTGITLILVKDAQENNPFFNLADFVTQSVSILFSSVTKTARFKNELFLYAS
jgi:hypothetical protein